MGEEFRVDQQLEPQEHAGARRRPRGRAGPTGQGGDGSWLHEDPLGTPFTALAAFLRAQRQLYVDADAAMIRHIETANSQCVTTNCAAL